MNIFYGGDIETVLQETPAAVPITVTMPPPLPAAWPRAPSKA